MPNGFVNFSERRSQCSIRALDTRSSHSGTVHSDLLSGLSSQSQALGTAAEVNVSKGLVRPEPLGSPVLEGEGVPYV